MQISIIDNKDYSQWIAFIKHHEDSTIFHHPKWLSILNEQYSFKTFIVCLFDKNKIMAGITMCEIKSILGKKKWVSLPFTDHSYPLYTSKSDILKIIEFLIEEKKKKNIASIEIRYQLPHQTVFFQKQDYSLHSTLININQRKLLNSFKETQVKQPIKKAQKEGLIVEISQHKDAVNSFYKLHLLTRKKLGVPIQPKGYFKKALKLLNLNLGFIILIKKENIVISAGIFLGFNKILTYKYGASHPKYLKLRPNNLLIWEAMLEGKKRNFEIFDFGKTEILNKGLVKFKSGWGSVKEDLYYSYFPEKKESKLFNILNKNLVTPAIKNSPKFVCRIIGELFYKFMG